MRDKYNELAKKASNKLIHSLDDDDWDQRPEFICKGCGNHVKTCTCRIKVSGKTRFRPKGIQIETF